MKRAQLRLWMHIDIGFLSKTFFPLVLARWVVFGSECDANSCSCDRGLNTGSPWNVPASSSVDLSEVIAKYEKENYAANEEKLRQLREDDVPAEKPLDSTGGFIKSNPASGGGG